MKIKHKYKAKTRYGQPQEGIWVHGDLVYDELRELAFIHTKDFGPKNDIYRPAEPVQVDPETICQCIDLQSVDGIEIYTNDYLEDTRGNKYLVRSVMGGFAINTFQDELNECRFYESTADMQNASFIESQCRIIGNACDKVLENEKETSH
jgi:hypothetical protein